MGLKSQALGTTQHTVRAYSTSHPNRELRAVWLLLISTGTAVPPTCHQQPGLSTARPAHNILLGLSPQGMASSHEQTAHDTFPTSADHWGSATADVLNQPQSTSSSRQVLQAGTASPCLIISHHTNVQTHAPVAVVLSCEQHRTANICAKEQFLFMPTAGARCSPSLALHCMAGLKALDPTAQTIACILHSLAGLKQTGIIFIQTSERKLFIRISPFYRLLHLSISNVPLRDLSSILHVFH